MKNPLVSIITPTFNHSRYIEKCLRSVVRQTYGRWEMVVVDDASSDGTPHLVSSLAATYPNIKLISHAVRRGVERLAECYEEAMAASRGELVALLDGDDWWAPDRLARQVRLFEDPSVVLSYGDCWEVSPEGRPIQYAATAICEESVRSSGAEAIVHFSKLASIPANTVLLRREALGRIGGFRSEGLPLVDYPTWLELSLQGDFVRVPQPIAYWRRHPGSVYWRNMGRIATGFHALFLRFMQSNRESITRAGLEPEALRGNADEALARMLSSLRYFDAKYELLCGDRSQALGKFVRVVRDPRTSLQHRFAGLLALGAGLSSPRLFFLALRAQRSMPRSGSPNTGSLVDTGGRS
jgi:glycosyltransferase involved in cell wall biosynthesis